MNSDSADLIQDLYEFIVKHAQGRTHRELGVIQEPKCHGATQAVAASAANNPRVVPHATAASHAHTNQARDIALGRAVDTDSGRSVKQ
jgi:hypothetical protein